MRRNFRTRPSEDRQDACPTLQPVQKPCCKRRARRDAVARSPSFVPPFRVQTAVNGCHGCRYAMPLAIIFHPFGVIRSCSQREQGYRRVNERDAAQPEASPYPLRAGRLFEGSAGVRAKVPSSEVPSCGTPSGCKLLGSCTRGVAVLYPWLLYFTRSGS
jgi:hypothetical protein